MAKPVLLLIAYRAFGDWLFTVPALKYLFEKYDVHLECSPKVWHLAHDDPRWRGVTCYDLSKTDPKIWDVEFPRRWQSIRDLLHPDKEINLNGSLELSCISETSQDAFFYPVGGRRVVFGSNGFYDAVFKRIGMDVPNPLDTTGMFISDEQKSWAENWYEKHKNEFLVTLALSGTTMQKKFPNYWEVADQILGRYPEARIYMTGDEDSEPLVLKHPRVHSLCGSRVSVKQSAHLMKYMNMVVGPETFIMVAAGMWGTPKMQMCTTSSVYQICQYQNNDYSMQAPIWCSPCHRAIYNREDCETPEVMADGETPIAGCAKRFPTAAIMERVDHVYQQWKTSRELTGHLQ